MRKPEFFTEWQTALTELTALEKQALDQVREGFINLRSYPPLLESTVNSAVLSPLLFIGKFWLPPFHPRSEKSIELVTQDGDRVIRGRIDFLLLRENLWVTVIESKQACYSVEAGVDQLLAYMLAAPQTTVYGLVTSSGSFMFVKLVKGESPSYGTSDVFDLRNQQNELYDVLQILKRLSQID